MQSAISSDPPPELPPVHLLATKYIAAAKTLVDHNKDGGILQPCPFKGAFEQIYSSDAHFVSYSVMVNGKYEQSPRCSKTLLSKIRTQGADVVTTMLVLDYDNPGHKTWGDSKALRDEARGKFLNDLSALADSWPFAWEWSLLYFTRGGARMVYVFDRPCIVEEFEQKHQWVCQEFTRRGIAIDCRVSDWTRCFRLPYVTREKELTWEADYSEMFFQYDNYISSSPIPMATSLRKANDYGEIKHYDSAMPSFDYARELCEFKDHHSNFLQTDWFKQAKRRLKGRECFDSLFGHKPLADVGSRNSMIHKYVGQAISLLFYLEGTEPNHIFGLFLPVVEQLDPDNETPDWFVVLWDHIQRLWAKEEAKDIEIKQVEIEKAQESLSTFSRVVHGMRGWCSHPQLQSSNDAEAISYAARRLIVSCDRNFYIMSSNGYYGPMQLNEKQIIPRVRIMDLDGVIETKVIGQDGGARDISTNELLNNYSTAVKEIRAVAEIEGAFVENMDTDHATLIVPSYRRARHFGAEYNSDVNDWLQKFFGENFELGCKWISWSLAWDEGCICALSLEGRAGSGKKMLTQGLAECLELPILAGPDDLIGDYQYGLLHSPFLVVNEGWPTIRQSKHPADAFRSLVSADPVRCNAKFQTPITARNPVRIIFTANNTDVVRQLAGNRDLSPEDREALAIRLLHLRINDDAPDWLSMKGGVGFTASPGKRWIAGDAGEKSDYIIAKHFMWLYQNRKGPLGKRFLIEGNGDQQIMEEMRTQSGSSPVVIETVIHLLDKTPRPAGVVVSNGLLYLSPAEVISHHRDEFGKTSKDKLTMQQVTKVFKGICCKVPVEGFVIPGKEKSGRKRWYEIDCELLKIVAERDGWKCSALDVICEEQRSRSAGTFSEITPEGMAKCNPQVRPTMFGNLAN